MPLSRISKSNYLRKQIYSCTVIIWQKDFPKALETLAKSPTQYQLDMKRKIHIRYYHLNVGYKFMTEILMELLKRWKKRTKTTEDKRDIAYMLGHLYYTKPTK